MKILWITNILFPEAESLLTHKTILKSSGGWLLGSSEYLTSNYDVNLAVAVPSKKVRQLTKIKGNRILYYIIPFGKGYFKYNKEYELYWKDIKQDFSPDIVHIHGTEYTHGFAYVRACGASNVVVSIQGMVSVLSDYYLYGIRLKDILCNLTIRDIVKGTMYKEKQQFRNQGLFETKLIGSVRHIIGRTSWDRAHVKNINSSAHYYCCNETLREEFYNDFSWQYDKCVKHSIFLSQGGYAIKGLHQVLKAMPYILKQYPDTVIRIAGPDITWSNGIGGIIHFSGYGRYIKRLIRTLGLKNNVTFVGYLDATQMILEYLNCNVFVCPSSIENSPNSLGEAQILGTPCVCSYVGGVPDFMAGDEKHLYRYEEITMLADKICMVFEGDGPSPEMRTIARNRHDREKNAKTLLSIYDKILSNS